MTPINDTISTYQIIMQVQKHTGYKWRTLCSSSRKKEVKEARFLAAAMLHYMGGHSLMMVGFLLGGRDHSTIIHELQAIGDLMKYDDIRSKVEELSPELLELLDGKKLAA